jgi:spore germination protein YaaH
LLRTTGASVNWSEAAKTPWFKYQDAGQDRTVWFENAGSLTSKISVARRHRLAGLSIWRLGNEDPAFWLPVARYRAGPGVRGWLSTAVTFLRNLTIP